jgi:hypothetical protein
MGRQNFIEAALENLCDVEILMRAAQEIRGS